MSDCIFCDFIKNKSNVLFENDKIFAMLSPEPFIPGHVMILPKHHSPIFEKVPDFVVGELFKAANKVGVAIFESLGAQGTNVLIQNGPVAGQRHNHVMVHVIPRFDKDNLAVGWSPKPVEEDVLSSLEKKIIDETKSVGSFEREKEKPIEIEKPKELPREDYRMKYFKRIP